MKEGWLGWGPAFSWGLPGVRTRSSLLWLLGLTRSKADVPPSWAGTTSHRSCLSGVCVGVGSESWPDSEQVSNGGATCVRWGPLAQSVSREQRPLSQAR